MTSAVAAAGLPAPARDHRLDRMADDMARVTPEDRQPSLDLVGFLLGYYGIIEPEPNLVFARGGPRSEEAIAALLIPQLVPLLRQQPQSRLGIGVFHGDELVVVLAIQEFHIDLRPVPRKLATGLVAEIEGRLLDGFRGARVIVTGPSGSVAELRVSHTGARFQAAIGCRRDQPGAYQIEIAAEADRGPSVLANFPVYCGVEPPAQSPPVPMDTGKPQDPTAAEDELFLLVNKERLARGISPLRRNDRLDQVARAHSREMAATGIVAHVSPRTGNAADRIKQTGLSVFMVAENVGRAYSGAQAHRGFMGSPGHRESVIDPRVTALGIGIAAGAYEGTAVPLFVTELFTEGL